jgi:hypothetical protein
MLANGPVVPARSSELALLAREPHVYAFYRWQNVAINAWATQPSAAGVDVLTKLTERSLLDCPEGIASIHWIESGAGLPTPEARVRLGELARRYDKHLLCVGVLLGGDGFWASAIRSALSGIVLLAPRGYTLRFYGEVPALSRFVAEQMRQRTGKAPDSARLSQVVEEALRQFKA